MKTCQSVTPVIVFTGTQKPLHLVVHVCECADTHAYMHAHTLAYENSIAAIMDHCNYLET